MNNAIVGLMRGYTDISKYNLIINRNRAIIRHIHNKFSVNYPLIIFHEGNVTQDHQHYIKDKTEFSDIEFIDISEVWNKMCDGYTSMCRFHSYDIWNYCKNYNLILRIDDDCDIESIEVDPFTQIKSNIFCKSVNVNEIHGDTNQTLPFFIQGITGLKPDNFYINFPYTNVMLSDVKFWLQSDVNSLLYKIAYSNGQVKWRWGDVPVLGSLLNIFAKDKVGTLDGLIYAHNSHKNIVNCTENKMFPNYRFMVTPGMSTQ